MQCSACKPVSCRRAAAATHGARAAATVASTPASARHRLARAGTPSQLGLHVASPGVRSTQPSMCPLFEGHDGGVHGSGLASGDEQEGGWPGGERRAAGGEAGAAASLAAPSPPARWQSHCHCRRGWLAAALQAWSSRRMRRGRRTAWGASAGRATSASGGTSAGARACGPIAAAQIASLRHAGR